MEPGLRWRRLPVRAARLFWSWDELAIAVFDAMLAAGNGVYHFWGHSWEIDDHGDWDRLERVLAHIGGRAEVDYAVPGRTSTGAQIEAVARKVEQRITRTYGELVAHTAGEDRRWAISALDASALREMALGAPPSHFPGLS